MTVSKSPRVGVTRWDSDNDPWSRDDWDDDNAQLEALGAEIVEALAPSLADVGACPTSTTATTVPDGEPPSTADGDESPEEEPVGATTSTTLEISPSGSSTTTATTEPPSDEPTG